MFTGDLKKNINLFANGEVDVNLFNDDAAWPNIKPSVNIGSVKVWRFANSNPPCIAFAKSSSITPRFNTFCDLLINNSCAAFNLPITYSFNSPPVLPSFKPSRYA